MAEENNLSPDTETSDEELSDNNVDGGLKNDSLTESNILQSDIRNAKGNPIATVSDRDHVNVKDTKLNKTEGKEKEIDFLIKSLKEDSCVESSVDSSELLQSIDKQNTAKEDEVERETIVSENYYDTDVGSSDLSLEESVDRNDKIKTLSDGQHESFESTNFTTVHPRQSMNSSASIERNEGEQTCKIKCASAKFFDEGSSYDCQQVTVTEVEPIKPPETPLFSFFFKRDADQLTNRKKFRRKKSSKVPNPQQLHVVQSPDGFIYCCTHNEVVKYWCHTCGILKCEKCVNFVLSRTCISHVVTTIEEHVNRTKEVQSQKIEKESNICLSTLDQAIRVLQRNEQQTELQALIQKDRIRQEFASFYHLLIEEEQTVLENIDTSLDKYRTQNRSCEQLYGSVVEYEADLMSKSLSLMEKDDPFGINLNKGEIIFCRDWFKLQDMTKEVLNSIPSMPTPIRDQFTLYRQKLDTGSSSQGLLGILTHIRSANVRFH
ncbi:uncharacterized protein [Mytilus edulis]|uniref:uncharacterized protein n=1 Tax=Mytilus edulis TaxID=6550 RepID=UPI0039EE2309